jgi:hypothetical protein
MFPCDSYARPSLNNFFASPLTCTKTGDGCNGGVTGEEVDGRLPVPSSSANATVEDIQGNSVTIRNVFWSAFRRLKVLEARGE